jgi:tRNA pseudouridine32 synthase/23S rRNA pseudouridine746 synthase
MRIAAQPAMGLPQRTNRVREGSSLPPLLFRDDQFVVLNKPAGLAVHPGPRGGRSVEDWFPLLSRRRHGPWLVHRLDADTAGCLLVALRRTALIAAQKEFAAGRARKTYWAIVRGTPALSSGTVNAPLLRQSTSNGWRMVVDPSGKQALTDWRMMGTVGELSWLELSPRTGRTHQVRVHCSVLGCSVLGDPIYGDADGPLNLLARSIALDLDPPVAATAPVPEHMRATLKRFGSGAD